jgi:hypothetical protein
MATLTTTRYTAPGVYIGQLIQPGPGNLNADARICNYVGRGSRLAVGLNLGIRRSFVYEEELTFSATAPYTATLDFAANGDQENPIRLYNEVTGLELNLDEWRFEKVGDDFKKVIISQRSFDPTAVYKIDYQSTSRDVLDPIPVDDIRSLKAVGLTQSTSQFEEYVDFFLPYTFAGPTASDSNFITDPFLTSIFADAGNTGGGTAAIDASASYNHNYNRFYQLEVTGISGTSPNFEATFEWSASRYSGGIDAGPPTPLHTTGTKPSFLAQENTPTSLVAELEYGIKVSISFGGTNFAIGDKFYFNGVGPGLIEFDGRLSNTNQYTEFGTVNSTAAGTGTLGYSADNTYTGTWNTNFKLEVTASAGAVGSRTATFIWAQYGEEIGATSTVLVDETVSNIFTLTDGVELEVDWGGANFTVGDVFWFEVKAPRIYYQAKDDREYKLTISAATNPGADTGYVSGSYATGTPEGSFGSWEANVNLLSGASQETGHFELPDGIIFAVRNAMRGNVNGTSFATGDSFIGDVVCDDMFDWSLTAQVEEVRETSSFITDVTGAVTGTAGTVYVILSNEYEGGTVVVEDETTGTPISHVEIAGTQFVAFVTTPTDSVIINYEFRGEEPAPGQLYYMTGNYLRTLDLYNNPTQILTREDGRIFLGPSETDNHLYIMNELVFDNAAPGAYYTQAYDNDGDGVITVTDMSEALSAHENVSRPTDLCVLSHFDSLSKSLAVNEKANDPFERREQMLWVGAPISTPIGDIDTPDSLVYLARNTLQVNPQSVALGTRVLVAPTEATKNVILENGVEQTITLDGSFVAGAASAKTNSFTDPGSTLLRQNLSGFNTLQTYSEPENLILGNASILWMSDQGASVFRFEEDITVHTNSEEFQLISGTVQKQYVTRVVRREMNNNLVGVVVPSAQAGVSLIQSQLAEILLGMLGRSLIADYQDDDGNVRDFDPDQDIVVIRDASTLTKYDFYYSYWIKAPIKRLFGLFTVNSNDFNIG